MLQRVLCALSAASILAAQQPAPSARPADLLQSKAQALESRGRLDLAAQTWQQLLMIDPNHQEALAGMARAAKKAGRQAEADTYLDKLRKLNAANPAIKQIETMGRVERHNPMLDEAGRLASSGQAEKAVAAYQRAFGGTVPPPEWTVPYYETLAGTPGGWEAATTALEATLQKRPGAQDAKLALGRLYTYRPATRLKGFAILQSVTGQFGLQAQQSWRQALIWENGSARSAESLRAYLSRYPDTELQAMAKKAPAPVGNPGGEELRKAYQALKTEDASAATKLFEEALAKNPKDAAALAGIGFARMKEQNFAEAQARFEAAVEIAPTNRIYRDALSEARFWVAMQTGEAALKEGRAQAALVEYDKARNLRPKNVDALHGYAGAAMQQGDYAAALPILDRVTKMEPNRSQAWVDLVRAKDNLSGPEQAIDILRKAPGAVVAKLNSELDQVAFLAGVYHRAGDLVTAKKMFDRAHALAEKSTDIPAQVEAQLGALYLQFDQPASAVTHYRAALRQTPENIDAWEGFLLASNRIGEAKAALKMLEILPPSVHQLAQERPGFLRAVAAVETSVGSVESAASLLAKAREIETVGGKNASLATMMQTAQVWLETGKAAQAEKVFDLLSRSYPENEEVWKGLVLSFHKQGAFEQAAETIKRIPVRPASALKRDTGFIAIASTVLKETGSPQEALQFLRESVAQLTDDGRSVPPELTVQLGWMLLESPGKERELFVLLRNARTRTDMPAAQRNALDEIWTSWLLRSSDAARKQGNLQEGIGILEAGVRMMPSNARLRRSLAAFFLSNEDPKRAYSLYKATGFNGATAGDYMAAVGASVAAKEERTADMWLREALIKFPNDTELLSLAGQRAASTGDFSKAEGFWKIALQRLDAQNQAELAKRLSTGPDAIKNLKPGDPTDDLGATLLSRTEALTSAGTQPAETFEYRLPWSNTKSSGTQSASPAERRQAESTRNTDALVSELLASQPETRAAATRPSERAKQPVLSTSLAGVARSAPAPAPQASKDSLNKMLDALQTPETRSDLQRSLQPATGSGSLKPVPETGRVEDLLTTSGTTSLAALLEPVAPAGPSTDRDKIVDQIKTVESRNSPYLGVGGRVLSRSGQSGFEKMMLQETTLESSVVASRRIRASVIARSVFADSAGPDGESLYRFGMLPQGDTFEGPSVNGLGAEVQVSGNNFGLRFGSTPRAFLVKNIIGGFRYRPMGGPITLTFERDSVKDTILAYAGAQDPLTKRVWGGVIANAGALNGDFGDEKSGVYFSLGFQHITGTSVQTNRRIDGTVGSYWRLARTPAGSLKAGVNLFAMHYAKNLRYFTVGHGGYFSPQRFYLFNVPVNWTGKVKRLEYLAGTSLGSQSFTEESSAYFPVDPLVQGKTGPYYPKFSSSGVNYNLDMRLAYQISENWFLVGFVNVNNARNYTQQSAGLSLRYSFRPKPLDVDVPAPSIPDWRGRQPFGLQ